MKIKKTKDGSRLSHYVIPFSNLPRASSPLAMAFVTAAYASPSALSFKLRSFPSFVARDFRISCAIKPETMNKGCAIVNKGLALPADTTVTGESNFATFGVDFIDTVEIVMSLEEFEISVEEENAQSIVTVQDATDLIEKLFEK
uniref:Carrier domain-containing protein n=1 Tax=Kalanchoe fedtschenkoi TaxID=63787 RepID=A0A7N0U2A5_KALFE